MSQNHQWFKVKLTSRNCPKEERIFKFRALTAGELRRWRILGMESFEGDTYVLAQATEHPDGEVAWKTEYYGTSETLINLIKEYTGLVGGDRIPNLLKEIDDDPMFTLETVAQLLFSISFEELDNAPQYYYLKTLHAARMAYEATTGKPIDMFFRLPEPEQEPIQLPPGYLR